MKNIISVLQKNQVFLNLGAEEIESMLHCLNFRKRKFKKGEFVLRQGEILSDILILISGNLHIQRDDYWGNRSILGHVSVGEIFGEAYAVSEKEKILNDVIAIADSEVLFLDFKRIITTCPSACSFHSAVIQNLFLAMSEKNRKLVQKLSHMSKRTTRDKLMSYLSEEAKRNNSSMFTIPFNRQELADFLSVDRSAMSNELCKMRDEGLIEFERSSFKLLE